MCSIIEELVTNYKPSHRLTIGQSKSKNGYKMITPKKTQNNIKGNSVIYGRRKN